MTKRSSHFEGNDDISHKSLKPDMAKVIFSPVRSEDSLSRGNSYKIWSELKHLIGDSFEIFPMGKKLKVSCTSENVKLLMETTSLNGISVSVVRDEERSVVKGIIHGVDIDLSDEDIMEGLNGSNSTKCVHVLRFKKGEQTLHTVVISFAGNKLPDSVKFGFRSFRVNVFIPRPIRCYNCQRYGHVSSKCSSTRRCKKCGQDHLSENCTNDSKCSNCGGNHEATSNQCSVLKEAKEIVRVKTIQKLSYSEAVKKVKSYSDQPQVVLPVQTPSTSTSNTLSQVRGENVLAPAAPAAVQSNVSSGKISIEPEALVELLYNLFYKMSGEKNFMTSRRAFMSFLIGSFNKSFDTNLDPTKMCLKLGIINKIGDFDSFLTSQLKVGSNQKLSSTDMETVSAVGDSEETVGQTP